MNKQYLLIKTKKTRLDTVITMYMPTDVKVNYNMKYTDTSIGSLTALGSQVIGEILQGDLVGVSQDKLSENAKEVG